MNNNIVNTVAYKKFNFCQDDKSYEFFISIDDNGYVWYDVNVLKHYIQTSSDFKVSLEKIDHIIEGIPNEDHSLINVEWNHDPVDAVSGRGLNKLFNNINWKKVGCEQKFSKFFRFKQKELMPEMFKFVKQNYCKNLPYPTE